MARSDPRSNRVNEPDALEHMSEVLAAERKVRQSVAACRDALNRQIAEQQEWARALQRRIHARLTRLHASCDRKIESRIAELREHARQAAPPIDLDQRDRECLQDAVEQLADQLIGRSRG